MPNPFLRLEQIQSAYLALLQANIRAALDEVQAFWTGEGDTLALPDVAQWYTGNVTDGFVRTLLTKWPAVTIEVTSVGPTQQREPLVANIESLFVTAYVLGQTPDQTDKLAHRYAAALAGIIATEKPADVGIKNAGPLSLIVGEAEGIQRVNYFKSSQVTCPLKIGMNLRGY